MISATKLLVWLLSLVMSMSMLSACMSELVPVNAELDAFAPAGAAIPDSTQRLIEGVYHVREGKEVFGDSVVLRWVHGKLYWYSGTSVLCAETAGSMQHDTASFSGYYRLIRSARTGDLQFKTIPNSNVKTISGSYHDHISSSGGTVLLEWSRAFVKRETPFHIIGHRAGARNSDRVGRSENSIEMAKFAEALGCTGIEIDIRLTKDRQLIVFHDETYSPRTVKSTYILGNVKDFTLDQARRHATLIYGEQIPTLREFLTAVVTETDLSLIWLDVKDPAVSEEIIQEQLAALRLAEARGRKIQILFGIPTIEGLAGFTQAPSAIDAEVLSELTIDQSLTIPQLRAWAPRWTNGTQNSESQQAKTDGKMVLTWTLDSPDYMKEYLKQGQFDGILTNYPSMLAGLAY